MILTVEELKRRVPTDIVDDVLEEKLQALESAIRKRTNNNFQNRGMRFVSDTNQIETALAQYLKIGDTLQVSQSTINNGLYTINSINGRILTLNEPIYEEQDVQFTKVDYPLPVREGVIEIMRWKLKNENQNYDANAEKDIQSETISRHSVTYAKDTTESDIDIEFGVPKKYTYFLQMYMKARF